ncbi:ATP-grasp domain-containing protein [Candidatus Woesearchaeota archaeon]|jgi:predicted ATP-grasp superfamily ATP-dependent carboligase|nr:ATP-grasp domain-containing protein [Candidatus Woesearchaeota archaeon]
MVCIITFARSWQTLIAARALGKQGITVITADSEKFATTFFSKYSKNNFIYTDPNENENKFVNDLIKKAKEYKKKYNEEIMLLPVHKETYTISKYRKKLSKHMKICVDDYDKIMSVHNKRKIPLLLKKYKIPTPKTIIVKDILELYKITPKLNFPVFIKLPESAASIGLVKVKNRDDLIYEFSNAVKKSKLKPRNYPIIQEGVGGEDYCVTALFNKGKKRAMMTYKNIKTYPYKSGPSVYRKNVNAEEMEKIATKFLEKIKWHGLAEIDFRMGSDKKPVLIEINPRFWGGLNQSVASNVNYPLLAYEIAVNGDCKTIKKYDKSVRTENLTTAILALFDEINKDEKKKKEIKKLEKHWKKAFKSNFKLHISEFFKQVKHINNKKYTRKKIKEFVKRRNKITKDDIIDVKDPFVVLGVLYPIHLFLKYGKVDKKMLTGEGSGKKK